MSDERTLPTGPCRMRVCYRKDGRLAYLGHLEVMNTIMRCVRRSGLPFEVGNGFARRMRISFSQALPVGASSRGEYYDLMLPAPMDEEEFLTSLVAATPHALAPVAAQLLPRKVPALEAWVDLSRWDVLVRQEGVSGERLDEAIAALAKRGYIDFMRGEKKRHLELAHTLVDWKACDGEDGVRLQLRTRATSDGSLRPAVLVDQAVGCAPLRVCRVGQWHEDDYGNLVSPMDV